MLFANQKFSRLGNNPNVLLHLLGQSTTHFTHSRTRQIEQEKSELASKELPQILELKFCELSLSFKSSGLDRLIQQFLDELSAKKVPLRPVFYFGDEWFTPLDRVAISIPFFLAHPKLKELELKMMGEVEGEDDEYFLKLLRHEAGHCFDHAYRLSRTPQWRQIFGSPAKEYAPENYIPNPKSKDFVRNLDHHYAQAHPEEDFAETFAVWLNPKSNWKKRYARWPIALRKLRYVDRSVKAYVGQAPTKTYSQGKSRARLPYDVQNLKSTLSAYYRRRMQALS